MFPILRKEVFSPHTFLCEVYAPDVAQAARAGQFVMVRLREGGERIPLTIADFNRGAGTITMVVKIVGKTTAEMAAYPAGGVLLDVVGPLGCPTRIERKGHVVVVGGGIGIAPLYPIVRSFSRIGTAVTTVLGFRQCSEVFWKERFEEYSDRILLLTEDDGCERSGTTVDGLREVIEDGVRIDQVITIGPTVMMQAVAELTRPCGIPTIASMNPVMLDGIGMCGSCRVRVGDRILFACVDGPDMDAHEVDFEEFKLRQNRFRKEEIEAADRYREECRLQGQGVGR